MVYTADHLLDALRIGPEAGSPRYRFHLRHARPLALLLAAAGAGCVIAALVTLPRVVLAGGLVLSAATAAHLAIAQSRFRRWAPKELSVALLYTAGIWFAPLLLGTRRSAWTWLLAGIHGLGVLLNLGMYSVFEAAIDRSEDSASVSRTAGAPAVERGVVALTALGVVAVAVGIVWGPARLARAWAPLLLVVATPAALLAFPSLFVPRFRYRIVGELVFVVLALPYLLSR